MTHGDSDDGKRQVAIVVRGVQGMKKMKKTLMTRDAPNVRNVLPKPWRWRVSAIASLILSDHSTCQLSSLLLFLVCKIDKIARLR